MTHLLPDRMARLAGWLLPALLLAARPAAAQPAAPDVDYRERRVFTVPLGGGPLTEDVEVSVTFRSPRSTLDAGASVYEQYFNRVTDFEASLDGRGVRRRQFATRQAQSADVFLSGGTVHAFTLPEPPRVGQTLSYRFRRTYPDAGYLPLVHVPNVNRLDRFEIVVNHPAGVPVALDVVTPRGLVPHQAEQGATAATLVFAGVERAPAVPLFSDGDYHAAVQLRVGEGAGARTPTTPAAFAAWYGALVGRVDTTATPRLRALAASLRRDTPAATVAAIHDHVRAGIRYVADARGESAFVPRAPDLVLANAYGDCKDRVWLVATLARLVGLRVDPVLTSTAPEPPVPGVGLGLYNHVVCSFDDGGRRVVFDPTDPHLPYGALSDVLVDARSLRLAPDGPEELRLAPQDSLPTLDVHVALDLDQPAHAAATVVLRGSAMGAAREARARGTAVDAANAVSEIAGGALYRIRLSHLELADDRPEAMTFTARADLSQFVVASPTRRYLPLTPFPAVPTSVAERRADALPLHLPARPSTRLRLTLPAGPWTAAPSAVAWGGREARFEARLALEDGRPTVTYHFDQRRRHFEGSARDAYLDLAERYLGARREVLTFTSTPE